MKDVIDLVKRKGSRLQLLSVNFVCLAMVLIIAPSIVYAQTTTQQQQPVPYLPPSQTTFAPSVFPPTQSFLPGTSFAVPTGNLSPWFPSAPAVSCGGTFYFTIVGNTSFKHQGSKHSEDNNNNKDSSSDGKSSDGKQTIALQVIAPGGVALDQNSVTGKIFVGQDNIDANKGHKFNVGNIANNCISSTFQDTNSDSATPPPPINPSSAAPATTSTNSITTAPNTAPAPSPSTLGIIPPT
jgi:hypothetical protein